MNRVQDFKSQSISQLREDINNFLKNNNHKLVDINYQLNYSTHHVLLVYDDTYAPPDVPDESKEDRNP